MKVGDLVRWTNPEAIALGVVVKVYKETGDWLDGRVSIVWQDCKHHTQHDPHHKYLELINESR